MRETMDAHEREGTAAVAAMVETYVGGTAAGTWDGHRRRWAVGDSVLFYHGGYVCRGHIMARYDGEECDTYAVRRHVEGGGSEVVEVMDRAMLVY